ncbi:MAG: hypothetical protein AB1304_07190 [Bacteroidota bacterium]
MDLLFDGDQLAKLPSLVHHFTEHHQREDINWIDFLIQHYIERHSQSDDHKHLPFKDHHDCTHIHFYYDKVQKLKFVNVIFSIQKFSITEYNFTLNPFLFSIWHPPKV